MKKKSRHPTMGPSVLASVMVLGGGALPGVTHGATAAPKEEIEEVLVTGIRASLRQAMDIKRDAVGVVDAISAEDIGKFPDNNVAETLARVTGIQIRRDSGEASAP